MTNHSNFTHHNGIVVESIKEDHAKGYVELKDVSMNQMGYAHGGIYFSLADSVAGAVAWSRGDVYVTLNATIDFMKPVQTGRLNAVGEAISRSGKICVVVVKIYDDKDQLVNQGTYTMYKVK